MRTFGKSSLELETTRERVDRPSKFRRSLLLSRGDDDDGDDDDAGRFRRSR